MDIFLETHDNEHVVALIDVFPENDYPGYRARLRVASGGFSAERPFWIERERVTIFVAALCTMDATLRGGARLQPLCDADYVALELTRSGRVIVTGELIEQANSPQSLRFGFETDQTCLRPLIRALEQLIGSGVAAG